MTDKCKGFIPCDGGAYSLPCNRDATKDGYCWQHHPDCIAAKCAYSPESPPPPTYAELLSILTELEWVADRYGDMFCPICRATVNVNDDAPLTHKIDCQLSALLIRSAQHAS